VAVMTDPRTEGEQWWLMTPGWRRVRPSGARLPINGFCAGQRLPSCGARDLELDVKISAAEEAAGNIVGRGGLHLRL
jgi:hypothetical protein